MHSFLNKAKSQIAKAVAGLTMAAAIPASVHAVTIENELKVEVVIGKVLDWLLLAGQLAGGGIMIYAMISFGLSIAQENPDQRSRAILFVVAGAFLVGIKPILKGIGVIDY